MPGPAAPPASDPTAASLLPSFSCGRGADPMLVGLEGTRALRTACSYSPGPWCKRYVAQHLELVWKERAHYPKWMLLHHDVTGTH